jgi:serine/threonine-protein kinase RIO1
MHGDLSEFNVLVSSEEPVIIDLPQSVNADCAPPYLAR